MKLPWLENARIEEAEFDLNRFKIRLEGLSGYGVVMTLLLNAALRLYSATPKKLDDRKTENAVKILFVACISICVVLGTYTAVAFQLLGLYSKTAMGIGADDELVEFFEATASIRHGAFASFLCVLVSFKVSFVLSLWLSYDGMIRWYLAGTTGVVALACVATWSRIMTIAGQLLYQA